MLPGSCPSPPAGAPLPAQYRVYAANIARWFPEVLLALGAPDLEDNFHPAPVRVIDDAQGRVLEVALQCRHAPLQRNAAEALRPGRREEVLESIDRLASDFEGLAAQLATVAHSQAEVPAAGTMSMSPGCHQMSSSSSSRGPSEMQATLPGAAVEDILALLSHYGISMPPGSLAVSASPAQTEPAQPAQVPSVERTLPAATYVSTESNSMSAGRVSALSKSCGALPGVVVADGVAVQPRSMGSAEKTTPTRRSRQVRQGARSRALPAKAAAWRNQRNSLKLSITKMQQLPEEPVSPKFVNKPKVWGARMCQPEAGPNPKDRSIDAVKANLGNKLKKLFGPISPKEAGH